MKYKNTSRKDSKSAVMKIAALSLVFLVVLIPIYSSSVYAASITAKISGADDAEGYIKTEDTLKASAIVSTGEDIISPSQVKIGDNVFQSCTNINPALKQFNCTYSAPFGGIVYGVYNIYFILRNYQGNTVASITKQLVTDYKVPVLSSLQAQSQIVNAPFRVNYQSSDSACNEAGCEGLCSGIGSVVVYSAGDRNNTLKIVIVNAPECALAGNFTLTPSSQSGTFYFCAFVKDRVGLESSSSCASVLVALAPPLISGLSIERTGYPVIFIGSNPLEVNISMNITSIAAISSENVRADFSAINSDYSSFVKADSCVGAENNITICTWKKTIKLSASKTGSIIVNATDSVGNSAKQDLQFSLTYDNTAPVADFFGTAAVFNGKSYVKQQGNTFLVKLSESGSGFSSGNVFGDFSAVNAAYQVYGIKADECVKKSDSLWECYWHNLSSTLSNGATANVYLVSSYDDAGNSVSGSSSQSFVVMDNVPPVVGNVLKKCVSSIGAFEYCKFDDVFSVTVAVTDASGVAAVGNFSKIFPGAEPKNGICNQLISGLYNCSWEFSDTKIPAGGHRQPAIYLSFSDAAGNTAVVSSNITVYEEINDAAPDFWQASSVTPMPPLVDRQTTALIPNGAKVFFHVALAPKPGFEDTEILALSLDKCSGDLAKVNGGKPLFFNNEGSDKKNPYFKFTLNRADFGDVDSLSFACNMTIYSRHANGITKNPESEPVAMAVLFYNLPVGELSQAIKDEIENAKNNNLVQNKMIGTLAKILGSIEKICNMVYLANQLSGSIDVLSTVFSALPGTSAVSNQFKKGATFLDGITYGTGDASKGAAPNRMGLVDFCAYVSCSGGTAKGYGFWGDWYGDFIRQDKLFGLDFAKMHFGCQSPLPSEVRINPSVPIDTAKCGALRWPESPKDSIVLSAATGCIPGVVRNLQKQRQIECAYIICMKESAKTGMPVTVCKEQKAYQTCRYTIGQVFQLIPFASFFQGLLLQFKTIMSNPISMIVGYVQFGCPVPPYKDGEQVPNNCRYIWGMTKITSAVGLFDRIKGLNGDPSKDLCDEALKDDVRG